MFINFFAWWRRLISAGEVVLMERAVAAIPREQYRYVLCHGCLRKLPEKNIIMNPEGQIRWEGICVIRQPLLCQMMAYFMDWHSQWRNIVILCYIALHPSGLDFLTCVWPCLGRKFCSVECEENASKFGASSELIAEIPGLCEEHDCDCSLLKLIAELGATKQVMHVTSYDMFCQLNSGMHKNPFH